MPFPHYTQHDGLLKYDEEQIDCVMNGNIYHHYHN